MAEYLAHYGTKGMKWGVRRYQNPDGTLTDEGRRHYGYGTKDLITKNTKQHIKRDALLGAIINGAPPAIASGMLAGSAAQSLTMLGASVLGGPIGAAAISAGATFILNAPQGAALGAGVGAIVGSISTKLGRRYIEANDTGLSEFIAREQNVTEGNREPKKVESNRPINDRTSDEFLNRERTELSKEIEKNKERLGDFADEKTLKWVASMYNIADSDHVLDQNMDEWVSALKEGKITKKQFNNVYEANLTNLARTVASMPFEQVEYYSEKPAKNGYEAPNNAEDYYRYRTRFGSYKKDETSKRGWVEIAESDPKNWKRASSKSGEREYEYVGPTSSDMARAKSFRSSGYTYAEIADIMGISESKVSDLLNK